MAIARTSLFLQITGHCQPRKSASCALKNFSKNNTLSGYFGVVHDQARYHRCHLPRASSRLLLAKAAREETSVGARQAAPGTISESACHAFGGGFSNAEFTSGNADPDAKVRSDCKTEAHTDVAQADAHAPPKPLNDSFQVGSAHRLPTLQQFSRQIFFCPEELASPIGP